jgi:hypothetical protein
VAGKAGGVGAPGVDGDENDVVAAGRRTRRRFRPTAGGKNEE